MCANAIATIFADMFLSRAHSPTSGISHMFNTDSDRQNESATAAHKKHATCRTFSSVIPHVVEQSLILHRERDHQDDIARISLDF
jgi:hypothetical protein